MDINSSAMEGICNSLIKDFYQYFDWNDIGINYSIINLSNKSVNVLSSDYDWLLTYWGEDIDLLINERLKAGIHYWNNY
ncbi:TPA: hypothetical protein ACYSAQ_003025 [Morganella morganii]